MRNKSLCTQKRFCVTDTITVALSEMEFTKIKTMFSRLITVEIISRFDEFNLCFENYNRCLPERIANNTSWIFKASQFIFFDLIIIELSAGIIHPEFTIAHLRTLFLFSPNVTDEEFFQHFFNHQIFQMIKISAILQVICYLSIMQCFLPFITEVISFSTALLNHHTLWVGTKITVMTNASDKFPP